MRLSKMVGRRLKDAPSDAVIPSHKFTIRGGFARQVSSGIYSLLPMGKRVIQKIENIIREEMNAIEGQEVLLPVVMPKELWEESGRYTSVGSELLRFKDRTDKEMVLGMTHEEAVVHLARSEIFSYKQLPAMMYQLQTKFRDEPRSRGGLIRVREFTMKDAYSFHRTQEDLESYYDECLQAYIRIFKRAGLVNFVVVKADSGMMGGAISHEFMLENESGEDTLVLCNKCDYSANREIAKGKRDYFKEDAKELKKVETPTQKTIEEVSSFLGVTQLQTAKAVFFTDDDNQLVFVCIRGDLEVEESKLKGLLKIRNLMPADDAAIRSIGCIPGYAGLFSVDAKNVRIVVDESIKESNNLVVGANQEGYHFVNYNLDRDCQSKYILADVASVRESDNCVQCGSSLRISRGIEIGNIFQLGTKYSSAMGFRYLDSDQKEKEVIMGCYGIGVGRLFASVIEDSHDEFGPIWPLSISPYQIQINALNYKKEEVKIAADKLYADFLAAGIEVLFDDRDEKAGFQFKDADLIGIPLRVIISPKTLETQEVEFKDRRGGEASRVKMEEIIHFVKAKLA